MATIYYAVIALKASEVETVAKELEGKQLNGAAKWLRDNKNDLYGNSREDWTPFLDKESIRDFLKSNPRVFTSVTNLIDDKIDDDASDVTALDDQTVDLYIIDVFALFLKKYKNLAFRMDPTIAKTAKCCLVIPSKISKDFHDIHDALVASYNNAWKSVSKAYREKGTLSRVALVADDLRNVRQFLLTQYKDVPGKPNRDTAQQVSEEVFHMAPSLPVPRYT